jgi:diaminopimelate epimerase
MIVFDKMHGAGNDFVLIDGRREPFEPDRASITRIAHRQFGVGCDQVIVLRASDRDDCLLRYEIWNADGSPARQCGNGARCLGLFLERSGEAGGSPLRVESPAGPVTLRRCDDGEYEVDMGVPEFRPERVPLQLETVDGVYRLASPWGLLELGAVSMGNPHALLLVPDIDDPAIPEIGAFVSTHEAFPQGCNAGFACIESPSRIRLRVVERGAGETLACGSGACAAVAILRRSGKVGDAVEVMLPGGRLAIRWRGDDLGVAMKGPAVHVFRGTMDE